ncbi:MAG: RluA family pseudouridine synthase [Verrucomicrobiota bacterium]
MVCEETNAPFEFDARSLRCTVLVEATVSERMRLDEYLGRAAAILPSKKAAYKASKRGDVRLNGEPSEPHQFVRAGDRIDILEPVGISLPAASFTPKVLYCDSWFAIVNKPPGVPVMGLFESSLELACAAAFPLSTAARTLPRAKPVHRLDVPTGGLVLVARTESVLRDLSGQFRNREVRKTYRAIVCGRMEGRGTLDAWLDGKSCRTDFICDAPVRSLTSDWVTAVTLHPKTGRTHQLRRHLAGVGHPIVGDREHAGDGRVLRGKGLFLAATGLALRHPTQPFHIGVHIPQPRKFNAYLEREARRFYRFQQKQQQ